MYNTTNPVSVETLLQRRQAEFIEKRTIIESEATKFLESLKLMDEDIKQQINYNPELTARSLFSSLWEEPFSMEKYNQQKAVFDNYVAGVEAVCNEINAEALRCLQES